MFSMDALRRHDIETARRTSPSEKARQALDLMRYGIELKRTNLRARHPHAADEEIERLLRAWLARDD